MKDLPIESRHPHILNCRCITIPKEAQPLSEMIKDDIELSHYYVTPEGELLFGVIII